MTVPLLKLYGERNTGTRYFTRLVNKNLRVKTLEGGLPWGIRKRIKYIKRIMSARRLEEIYLYVTFPWYLGWKHMRVMDAGDLRKYRVCSKNLSFVTLTKNPYSWLLSLHRNPYQKGRLQDLDFETFLNTKWITTPFENAPEIISSPVKLWNIKNAAYLQLKDQLPTMHFTYEILLEDPEKVISQISDKFSLDWKVDKFVNYEKSTKEKDKSLDYYRDYYLQEKWKEDLSARAISIINSQLDDSLMNYFSYQKLA